MAVIYGDTTKAFFQYFGVAFFGFYSLRLLAKVLNNLATFYLGFGSVDFKKYGSWAVVTGCTDGIGKAYAQQLAQRGLNIVLISRTLEKLEEQSKWIQEKFKVETLVIAVDFTSRRFCGVYNYCWLSSVLRI
jgi:17beta-estradiol 17-dehydrogenase / very-long-chain 3-oxoacyl-CoA reductase